MFDESLITSEVCVECGACCSAYLKKGTDEPLLFEEKVAGVEYEVVSCRFLDTRNGQYRCRQYRDRPQICRQYHCFEKANAQGLDMPADNPLAQRVRAAVQKVHGRSIELILQT